jgi:ribosomal protein S18 acetylase RimI-like enzyme
MPKSVDLSLRSLVAADLPAIEALLLANRPVFSDAECRTAVEMIHETLAQPDEEDPYQFVVAYEKQQLRGGPSPAAPAPPPPAGVVGYACFGRIPLTEGTFDLYWIAVHPDFHAKGVGKVLIVHCEEEIARQGGHLMVVETASRKEYDKTRRFYEKTMGYETAAWIKDFYKKGDDKVVYIKYLR